MKPSEALKVHKVDIHRIITASHATNPGVFGSVLHERDTENSDLDILVDLTPKTTLLDITTIQCALEKMLGVSVDVLTPNALPEKFRSTVINEARTI